MTDHPGFPKTGGFPGCEILGLNQTVSGPTGTVGHPDTCPL